MLIRCSGPHVFVPKEKPDRAFDLCLESRKSFFRDISAAAEELGFQV